MIIVLFVLFFLLGIGLLFTASDEVAFVGTIGYFILLIALFIMLVS